MGSNKENLTNNFGPFIRSRTYSIWN